MVIFVSAWVHLSHLLYVLFLLINTTCSTSGVRYFTHFRRFLELSRVFSITQPPLLELRHADSNSTMWAIVFYKENSSWVNEDLSATQFDHVLVSIQALSSLIVVCIHPDIKCRNYEPDDEGGERKSVRERSFISRQNAVHRARMA